MVSVQYLIDKSRDRMGKVHPAVERRVIQLIEQAHKEGIAVMMTSGFRSFYQQALLYGQGRPWYTYDGKKVGRSGSRVTNAKPGQSVHNYGLAVDFALVNSHGNPYWTFNKDWKRVAAIGKKLGFMWGGDWTSFTDYPHLDLCGGLGWRELSQGKRPTRLLQTPREDRAYMMKGDTGDEVAQLQRNLKEIGYQIEADGVYGPKTESVVKEFQKKYKLKVDGVAGSQTIIALKEGINVADTGFKDVNKDMENADLVKYAKEQGLVEGFTDGTFHPEEEIKRIDAVAVIARAHQAALKEIDALKKELKKAQK